MQIFLLPGTNLRHQLLIKPEIHYGEYASYLPKRMSSVLAAESLLNDAASLIIFRFAMIAVATGQFIRYNAALSFSWMLIVGIGIGLLVGWIFMKAHRNFIKVADSRNPGVKVTLIMGWTGMRGVVSLAAALSIPVQLADGSAFP